MRIDKTPTPMKISEHKFLENKKELGIIPNSKTKRGKMKLKE